MNTSIGYNFVMDVNKFEWVVLMTFVCLYVIIGILINIFYISLNIFNKKVREYCEYFSLTMSLSYLLGCLICLTVMILINANVLLPTDISACFIAYFGSCYLAIQSQLSILSIFLNRFLLIRFPFKYKIFCSNKFTLFFVILCNIFSLFVSSIALFIKFGQTSLCRGYLSLNYVTINIILFFSLIPFIPSFILYLLILKIAKKHASSIQNQLHSNKSISKMAKFTFFKLVTSLVSWIIYGILYKQLLEDLTKFSWKQALLLEFVLFQNICLSSLIILITNSKILSKIENFKLFMFFKTKIHIVSSE